jgi:hypothetical protein
MIVFVLATPAWSKRNNLNIDLRYTPQQTVGASQLEVDPQQLETPVRLRLVDPRPAARAQEIGQRTDDDDRVFTLLATTPVGEFVERTLVEIGRQWGIVDQDESDILLDGMLLRFEVHEANQAVGATFKASVGLAFELQQGGATLWTGKATGDATRYGKKFSNENCNEVLSDALLEAFAQIVSEPGLHAAWAGRPAPAIAGADVERAIAPERLLQSIKDLLAQSMSWNTIVEFIGTQRLSRALTAEDLASWKAEGVAEDAIRAALRCPVGAQPD